MHCKWNENLFIIRCLWQPESPLSCYNWVNDRSFGLCVCPFLSPLQQEMACSWSFYQVTAVSFFSLSLSSSHTNTFSLLLVRSKNLSISSAALLRLDFDGHYSWPISMTYYHMDYFFFLYIYKATSGLFMSIKVFPSLILDIFQSFSFISAAYLWKLSHKRAQYFICNVQDLSSRILIMLDKKFKWKRYLTF